MNLRKSIARPQKLQDEIAYGKNAKDPSKPAYPRLLQSQIVPFNPRLPPAAFPTLPFPKDNHGEGEAEAILRTDVDAEAGSGGLSKSLPGRVVNYNMY